MERNLFQSLNVPLDDDDYENGNLSDEVELSDEDEWVPPCEESEDSESSDEGHTYTELAPANVNIAVPLDGTSNDPYEGEDATSSSNSIVLGKDKQTEWMTKPFPDTRTPSKNILKISKNKTPFTNHVTSPNDAFHLFVDDNMIQKIVHYTNVEGKREKGKEWQDTDSTEIQAFIGCLLHTGALHQNDLSLEMLFSPVDGNSLVRAAFGLRRFSSLLNHLRFDDKATRSARRARDVFAPIRELWDLFHTNLGKHYVAGQNITVDEQLVPFRGRCSFIQYMPSKPDKYGLKFFWASDAASNYPLRGFPYLSEQMAAKPPKRARVEESAPSAKKQKRCALCPAKRDRKTKSTCSSCDCHICQEHTVLFCQNCHAATS